MKVTVNGITFEGSEDEVKRMIEWQEKRMMIPTSGGGSSAREPIESPYEVSCDNVSYEATSGSKGSIKMACQCPRGLSSRDGCEYYICGKCCSTWFKEYPSKYRNCVFSGTASNTAM